MHENRRIAITVCMLLMIVALKDMDMQYYLVQNDYYFDVQLYFAIILTIITIAVINLPDLKGEKYAVAR